MATIKNYAEDVRIAESILQRDGNVSREYLFVKCYPLFASIYNHYYTDCESVFEFIQQIYVLILTPSKKTGLCQLQNYRGESTLTTWLKAVCLFYCYDKFEKKKRQGSRVEGWIDDEGEMIDTDIFNNISTSIDMDLSDLARSDIDVIISMMPNPRYRKLFKLRYLEDYTNDETAKALGMTMANYYNKHKLAKDQFDKMLRKEEQHV